MGVNLSARQFTDPSLVSITAEAIAEAGIAPHEHEHEHEHEPMFNDAVGDPAGRTRSPNMGAGQLQPGGGSGFAVTDQGQTGAGAVLAPLSWPF